MGFNVLFLPEDLLETDDRRLVRNHSFPQLFDFNGLLVYRARLALSELLELVLEFGNSCVFFLALLLDLVVVLHLRVILVLAPGLLLLVLPLFFLLEVVLERTDFVN